MDRILFLTFALVALFLSAPLFAQEAPTPQDSSADPQTGLTRREARKNLDPDDPNVVVLGQDIFRVEPAAPGYTRPKLKNLIKSLWALKMFGPEDTKALDEYILAQNCETYRQYQQNDFLWKRIREATLQDMNISLPYAPVRYEIITSLFLDRYDFNLGGFAIRTDSRLDKVSLIPLTSPMAKLLLTGKCFKQDELKTYPEMLTARLDNPITFNVIPMPENQANTLMQKMNEAGNRERQVALILRLRLTGIDNAFEQSRKRLQTDERRVTAHVESLAIFSDNTLKNQIYTHSFEN